MALPKNKSRKIIVNDIPFRYAISTTLIEDSNYDYKLNITVQSESNGSKLLIKGLRTRDFWLDISDHPEDLSQYKIVTPKHMECFINIALEKGWEHSVKGENFQLNANKNDIGYLGS